MKVIIAGSRDMNFPMSRLIEIINIAAFPISEVVSGHSGYVDLIGEQWAKGVNLPVKLFPASWNIHGLAAGPKRNRQMAEYADALIAIWDGESKGTLNMIKEASKRNKPVFITQP